MSNQDMPMEQRLNALADGELNQTESEELLCLIEQDPDLRGDLCDIHRIKDMVHYAYPENGRTESSENSSGRNGIAWAAAATILFTLGTLIGVSIPHESQSNKTFSLDQIATQQPNKFVLYLNDSDETKFQTALEKAEFLLKSGQDKGMEVDIVVSAGGIDMLRGVNTSISGQIKTLAANYDFLQFVACSKTLEMRELEGKPVNLVREANVAPSDVEFIVVRLQEGWSYIAI